MSHVLDRPVWSALATRHAALAEGGPLARRYDPSIVPFAAACDDSEEALRALAALAGPDDSLFVVEAGSIAVPPGFAPAMSASLVQMALVRPPPVAPEDGIERLGEADAAEMLALATLTRPGPFTLRAQALGAFFGIRIAGRIAAMAGEPMKHEGFTEVSGVCTHPDFQGRGLGRKLSVFMSRRVVAAGETPYLHAYATNAAAIRLYESIGYELRSTMNAAVIRAEALAAG